MRSVRYSCQIRNTVGIEIGLQSGLHLTEDSRYGSGWTSFEKVLAHLWDDAKTLSLQSSGGLAGVD